MLLKNTISFLTVITVEAARKSSSRIIISVEEKLPYNNRDLLAYRNDGLAKIDDLYLYHISWGGDSTASGPIKDDDYDSDDGLEPVPRPTPKLFSSSDKNDDGPKTTSALVPSPTRRPTRAPVPSPTRDPTSRPTRDPTHEPTRRLTRVPVPSSDDLLDRPIRVACAGDSLTLGESGGVSPGDDYPTQLQQLLGNENFVVHNYGLRSVTAIRGLQDSYDRTREFQNSLEFDGDIYLLMLGTNDAKFWSTDGRWFPSDMESLVEEVTSSSYRRQPRQRVIMAIPPWVKSDWGCIKNDILVRSVQPAIKEFAKIQQLQLVDMYDITVNENDFFTGDGLHLNAKGYSVLAEAWKNAIRCNNNDICEVGEDCESCPQDCFVNCARKL